MDPDTRLTATVELLLPGSGRRRELTYGILQLDGHVVTVEADGGVVASASAGDGGRLVISNDRLILRDRDGHTVRARFAEFPRGMMFGGFQLFLYWRNRTLRTWDRTLRARGFRVRNSNRIGSLVVLVPVTVFAVLILVALLVQVIQSVSS